MASFPFEAWYWTCTKPRKGKPCGEKNPKRVWQNAIFDPVEYLECLECGAAFDGKQPVEEGKVRWLWRCECGFDVSWKEDFCHGCGRAWLADRPKKKDGGKPTVKVPKYHDPTPEELIDAWTKIWKGQKHKPIPGCPETCKLPHEFTLRLEADRDVGCPTLPAKVHALLEPAIDPKNPKGTLAWSLVEGGDVASLPGDVTQLSGDGTKTEMLLVPRVDEGLTKFPGGTVGVVCEWDFGGPADVPIRASLRLPFHAGVTADCPKTCPEPAVGPLELHVVEPGGGSRLLAPGQLLCPGEDVVFVVRATPPPAGTAEVTLTLVGEPAPGRGFEGGGLLGFGDDTLTTPYGAEVRLRPGDGEWQAGAPVPVPLAPASITLGGAATFHVAPARLRVTLDGPGGKVEQEVELAWHDVSLAGQAEWHGLQGGGASCDPVKLRVVANIGDPEHEGAYAATDASHVNQTPFCAGVGEDHAWHARVASLTGSSTGCVRGGSCVDGRFGAGFVQAHDRPGRWWKYEREGSQGERWLKVVAAHGAAMPLRDAKDGVAGPWFDHPVVLDTPTSTASTEEWSTTALGSSFTGDSPWAHASWRQAPDAHPGRTYALRRFVVDDSFQTTFCVGLRSHTDGVWRALCPLQTLDWRWRLDAALTEPAGRTDATISAQAALLPSSGWSVHPDALRGRPRPNDTESFRQYLSETEPTGPEPTLGGCAVTGLCLSGAGGDSASYVAGDPVGPATFVFAPGHDTVRVRWTIDAPPGITPAARLELRRKDDLTPWALWARTLPPSDCAAGEHSWDWDGALEGGAPAFPGGFASLDGSPYELRLVLVDVEGPGRSAFTHFKVEAAKLSLEVGPKAMVEETGAHVSLGAQGLPGQGEAVTLMLGSPLFTSSSEVDEKYDESHAREYERLWGEGPELGIVARVWLRAHDRSEVLAPRAVGRVRIVFGFDEDPADISDYNTRAQEFVARVRGKGLEAPAKGNTPVEFGGKRGEGGARVLTTSPGYPPATTLRAGQVPFRVRAGSGAPQLVVSESWTDGALGGCAGVLFRPSRIVGDGYCLRAALCLTDADVARLDVAGDPWPVASAPPVLHAKTGAIHIARRVPVGHYIRKRDDVDAVTWSLVHDDLGKGGGVHLSAPAAQRVVGQAEWDERFAQALALEAESFEYFRHAFDAAQHEAGPDAVVVRGYPAFKAAAEEASNLPADWTPNLPTQEEYEETVADAWARRLWLRMAGGFLKEAPSGLTVLHTGKLGTSGSDGLAPAGLEGVRRSRMAVLVYQQKNAIADADTLVHEGGHALFLPHAPGFTPDSGYKDPDGHSAKHHDGGADPFCWMSYVLQGKLCGMCVARLAGMGPTSSLKIAGST